ncbi:murein biosynthesis integral membrane protein MurJ [Allofranklinella schreckenbergeri]|uniref:Probable lipid II flippase MurJ n=1 Tax=Allofranklinella schreckenbergeri TaxID=1076744 RepID=A0A3M6R5H7_9BURK|nr:murein biosynthesis integral membrane protein MurJ [Allofranklinella schreckenbergeri]RMX10414.1 murein biosynthesis integral membrane protein MurJ [Allofranklinella schreckenbergeri]
MSLFKAASTVSLMTLLSRITGLVRDLLMATIFGANALTDAFNVAFRIPNLFRRLFAEGAFSQAFVPVLASTRAQQGDAATQALIDRVATILFWALIAFSALGVLGAPLLVWLLASGLHSEAGAFDAAVRMTRWMFPYIACMSLVAFASAILNTWRRYAIPAATPVLLNLCMIAAALGLAPWFARQGWEPIFAMAAGVMAGGLLQLGIQWLALRRLGLLPRLGGSPRSVRAAWGDSGVRRILRLMAPALLGVGVAQISLMINTQIASHLQAGSVTWLFYADRLMEFPTALLGVALGVVLTPQLASAQASGKVGEYSAMLDWGLRVVVTLALPCAAGLVFFATPLVATLFHYGALGGADVRQIALALMGYGAGLLGLVAVKVLAPGYYAREDMRTPVKIAVIVLVLTQVFNIVLVPWLGHAGLALGIGLGSMVNASLLLVGLIRRGAYQPGPGWVRLGFQILAALIALVMFLSWASQWQDWLALQEQPLHRVLTLAWMLAAAIALYFGTLWAARCDLRALLRHSGQG